MVLPKWNRLTVFPGLACLLLLSSNALAQHSYCCQDPASGRRICGDVLPAACKSVAYKVYDRAGNITEEVGPPLTPEQKIAKEVEERRRVERENAQREQRRKDSALLETYSSIQDIDISLARAEADLVKSMNLAQAQIENAKKKRKKFEEEAKKHKEVPSEIVRGLRDADDEIRAHSSVIASKKKDLEMVRAKFSADRRRYQEIISGGGHLSHPDAKRSFDQNADSRK